MQVFIKNKGIKLLKIFLILSLLILLAYNFVACSDIQSFEWQGKSEISFTLQPTYKGIRKSYNAVTTKTDKATYYADAGLPLKSKNQVVTYLEQVLDRLSIATPLNVYIYEDAGNGFVMEMDGLNAVHISPSASKMDIIIASLQGVKSPYVNYGLLYGIAAELHNELGYGDIKTKSEKQIKEFVSQNTDFDLYDLNYPSFTEKYGYNTDMAKSIAVNFVRHLKNKFGEETPEKLLDFSADFNFTFEHLYAVYMNEFLHSMGWKYSVVFPCSQIIKYASYTSDYPLRICTVSCDYYLYKDYKDPDFENDGYYFDFKYSTIKNIFCEFEKAYARIRTDFEYGDSDRVAVIIDQNDKYLDMLDIGGTMDIDSGDNIRLRQIYGAVHEYAHSIAIRKYGFIRSWLTESLCDYYYFDVDFIIESLDLVEMYGWYFNVQPEIQIRLENLYKYFILCGKSFDEYDVVDFMALAVYTNPLEVSKFSNFSSRSFLLYIINNYGIKSAIKLYTNPTGFEAILGKTADEMIADWQCYLQEKFEMISY